MAATQNPDGADTALDQLEVALERIARGVRAPKPATPLPSGTLHRVEQRLDTVIDYVKSTLGRKIDP